jgi:hypothetical protein
MIYRITLIKDDILPEVKKPTRYLACYCAFLFFLFIKYNDSILVLLFKVTGILYLRVLKVTGIQVTGCLNRPGILEFIFIFFQSRKKINELATA